MPFVYMFLEYLEGRIIFFPPKIKTFFSRQNFPPNLIFYVSRFENQVLAVVFLSVAIP